VTLKRILLDPSTWTEGHHAATTVPCPLTGDIFGSATHLRIPHFPEDLASVLVKMKVDPKLVQEMLGHQNLKTTVEVYAKAVTEDKIEAQAMFLKLLFSERKGSAPDPVKNLEKAAPATGLVQ
jgi:hypothetical protein